MGGAVAFGSRRPGKLGALGITPPRGGGRKLTTHVVNTATFDQMEPEEPKEGSDAEATDATAAADATAYATARRAPRRIRPGYL